MAEVLGAVGSIVGVAAFAQQLAQSVYKIKRFCDNVRNAPSELQDTLEHIANMVALLENLGQEAALDHEASHLPAGAILKQCLELCRRAAERINSIANDLQNELQTRKRRAAIHIVIRQDAMDKLLTRLDRSKSDLVLAYTMFSDARRSSEMEVLRKQLQEMQMGQAQIVQNTRGRSSPTDEEQQNPVKAAVSRQRKRRYGNISEKAVRFQLPAWFCSYACEISFQRASGCWNTSLKTFRILPWDHPASHMCMKGDVEGIRGLLDARKLTVHDRNPAGSTIVTIAASHGATKILRLLVDHGAEPFWQLNSWSGQVTRSYYAGVFSPGNLDPAAVKDFARFISDEFDVDFSMCDFEFDFKIFATEEAVLTHQDQLTLLCHCGPQQAEEWILDRARSSILDPELVRARGPKSITLLHILSEIWSSEFVDGWDAVQALPRLITRVVEAGADLHAHDDDGLSPLMIVITAIWNGYCLRPTREGCTGEMRRWVDLLQDANVNLRTYGHREGEYQRECSWQPQSFVIGHGLDSSYYGFTYGAIPSEWHMWVGTPFDTYAGTFWALFESPPLHVPGAWPTSTADIKRFPTSNGRCPVGIKRKVFRRIERSVEAHQDPTVLSRLAEAVSAWAALSKQYARSNIQYYEDDHHTAGLLLELIAAARGLGIERAQWDQCIKIWQR